MHIFASSFKLNNGKCTTFREFFSSYDSEEIFYKGNVLYNKMKNIIIMILYYIKIYQLYNRTFLEGAQIFSKNKIFLKNLSNLETFLKSLSEYIFKFLRNRLLSHIYLYLP